MSASEGVELEQLRIDPKTKKFVDTRKKVTGDCEFATGVGILEFQQNFIINGELQSSSFIGTGTLISEDTVLTCAHNVINRKLKNDRRKITKGKPVSKFAYSFNMKFTVNNEEAKVESFIYPPKFLNDPESEYALLELDTEFEIGEDFLEYREVSDSFLKDGRIRYYVIGQKDGQLVYDCGGICSYSDDKISYKFSTNYGQSGGPVVTKINDEFVIVGIHFGGVRYADGDVKNSAMRINENVVEFIE